MDDITINGYTLADGDFSTEFTFGKYNGMTIGEVVSLGDDGIRYLGWVARNLFSADIHFEVCYCLSMLGSSDVSLYEAEHPEYALRQAQLARWDNA